MGWDECLIAERGYPDARQGDEGGKTRPYDGFYFLSCS